MDAKDNTREREGRGLERVTSVGQSWHGGKRGKGAGKGKSTDLLTYGYNSKWGSRPWVTSNSKLVHKLRAGAWVWGVAGVECLGLEERKRRGKL